MFKKYSSIENAYRQKHIDRCHELGNNDWVVLEKIHGANFGFIVTSDNAQPFKRTSVIERRDTGIFDFYGCTEVVNRYTDDLLLLRHFVGKDFIMYGELYGDGIQSNVDYGYKDFVAFDIYFPDEEVYMGSDEFLDCCVDFQIRTVPFMFRGTLAECLAISPEFDSILAKENGRKCKAEGVVIKQASNEKFFGNDGRAIIKNKSKDFSEKKNAAPKKPSTVPEELKETYEEFCKYLSKNRLDNVLSKEGKVEQKDFGRIMGLLISDAMEDYRKDHGNIEKDDWKKISKFAGKEAGSIIREDWLNILDRG